MTAALELDRRLRRAGQAVAFLAASLPIAILAAIDVLLLVAGAALSVVGVGLPLLLGAAAAGRALLRAERRVANRLLHAQIPPLHAPAPRAPEGLWRRSLHTLGDRTLWRMAAVLAVLPLIVAGLVVVAVTPVLLLAQIVVVGVEGVGGLGHLDYVGPWAFGGGVGLALCALALPTAVVAVAVLDGLERAACSIVSGLLAPRAAPTGPVREMLAESLGDRSVSIAYWLPDRNVFVDETGRPVRLPEPGSGRAWTAVERDGRRVAAIIHDAALDTSRELVHAAAAASSLAIDNERLKADLRARLEELRRSRLRIVEATDEARRRIERDLHDGAQQQLVALALELRLLRARVREDGETVALVDRLADRLAVALEELRELARGIHPAILTERGLEPAIEALAERSPLDVELGVGVHERLPAPIEAAAYFVVAEGLTNVTKYAGATHARVDVDREGRSVVVRVTDDGGGGVDLDAGSGLRGLQDRLAAVDGTLDIESPPGGGTRLVARIPTQRTRTGPPGRSWPEEVGA